MDWYKTYQDGILRGSLSRTSDTTQLIWVKMLAIENETRLRDGWLHFRPGEPMNREYLAMVCGVSLDNFNKAIDEFLGDHDQQGHPRIIIADDGDIFIKNWEKYQAKPEKVIAKEIAREQAAARKHRTDTILERALQVVNEMNIKTNAYRYAVVEAGKVVDTKTGEVFTVEELEANHRGNK